MRSLKKIININLRRLTAAMMILSLLIAVFLQILNAQEQVRENAEATFFQISQLLQQNAAELVTVEEDYRETCLLNAEAIAYIVQSKPEIIGNVEEFRLLAYMLQVDEIHIFDDTGRIFTGTHPEYFEMTFDSGEQIGFFKPLMEDKSLRLCQDITPNTAESKLVQYSALWSPDGRFIVQVGMYPDTVLAVTEKNELSFIFSLLQGSPGISLYAIDPDTGLVMGSSSGTDNGKPMEQIGFSKNDLLRYQKGSHLMVNGVNSFCVFEQADDTLIGYVISNDRLYGNIFGYTAVLAFCLVLVAAVIVLLVQLLINQYIVGSISRINEKLRVLGAGNLDERMGEHSSMEFAELSAHINQMVQDLLATTDKMSLVLDHTDLRIGVYEYNTAMKTVRFTEHIPEIFGLSHKEMSVLAADQHKLKAFIDRLRQEQVPQRENTYRYVGDQELFLTLEEVTNGNDVMGIVMDVTEEMHSLRQAETERDMDLLTGLYNRRGIMGRVEALFSGDTDLGYGAIVMLDADNLKEVNDSRGHLIGDAYLKRLADLLQDFSAPNRLSGRIGGDEFLLVICGYETEEQLLEALARIRFLQKNTVLHLEDGSELPLRFSFGYTLTYGRDDLNCMMAEADGHMYHVKRIRKRAYQEKYKAGSAEPQE